MQFVRLSAPALLAVLSCLPAAGETAILECTADGYSSGGPVTTRSREMPMPGLIIVSFRTWDVTRWSVDSATMFVHIARGDLPSKVEVAAFPSPWGEVQPPRLDPARLHWTSQAATAEPQNWMSVKVPPAMVEDMAANRAHGFAIRFKTPKELAVHARETVSFAPYLIVIGSRK